MAYRSPGVYASFERTAAAPVNVGASRIMALIGTGIDYYTVVNESVTRNSNKPYDVLKHKNVFEITVSERPIYATKNNPENIIYTPTLYNSSGLITQEGDYELVNGNYIVWRSLSRKSSDNADVQLNLENVDTDPYINEGSRAFANNSNNFWHVDANKQYLIVDGTWRIEVTYAAKTDGCYRVINEDTSELIGEYVVNTEPNTEAIPGIELTIGSTYKKPDDADIDSDENLIAAGDYFILSTQAYKTELEATLEITGATVDSFKSGVKKINLINPDRVQAGTYKVVFTDDSLNFQVTKATDSGDEIIYPVAGDSTQSQPWIAGDEIYDRIPGFEIILGSFPATAVPVKDNTITFTATERQITIDEDSNVIPGEGNTYYVNYKYRKDEAGYEPQYFSSYKDILAEYGDFEVTTSGVVKNSLTLGANIAFSNGVSQIICVQAKGNSNSDVEFCNAIDRLRQPIPGVDNVNTIVPLTTSAVVGTYCAKHVTIMSSYDYSKECMCYLGAFPGQKMSKFPSNSDRSLGIMEACEGYNNERVVFVAPGRAIKAITNNSNGLTYDRPLPACYLAVAVACLGLGSDPAEPLTNKAITGFSYLPDTYTENELNNMAAKGACLLFMRGNNIIVRHGITTDPSDVNTYEITSVQIKDYVIEAVRSSCKQYIGRKNTNNVVSDITYTINTILSQFVNRVIIESYTGLSVERSADDPRAVNVTFKIKPIYSLTYIDITFSFAS